MHPQGCVFDAFKRGMGNTPSGCLSVLLFHIRTPNYYGEQLWIACSTLHNNTSFVVLFSKRKAHVSCMARSL